VSGIYPKDIKWYKIMDKFNIHMYNLDAKKIYIIDIKTNHNKLKRISLMPILMFFHFTLYNKHIFNILYFSRIEIVYFIASFLK
jgi:hypothetical protein